MSALKCLALLYEFYLSYDSTRKDLSSLERHGYVANDLSVGDNEVAYPIHDLFFDLPATEMIIPKDNHVSWWTVKVEATAKQPHPILSSGWV